MPPTCKCGLVNLSYSRRILADGAYHTLDSCDDTEETKLLRHHKVTLRRLMCPCGEDDCPRAISVNDAFKAEHKSLLERMQKLEANIVDLWHRTPNDTHDPLWKYLDMSPEDYSEWVRGK